tara:strand:- start:11754 stop:12044 length:291 start_codon:yes stop_codon:yes gene_type:complete
MEELPIEVHRVYNKSLKQLKNIQLPELNTTELLNSSVTKMIDETRQQLAKADLMLSDVQSIINSYVEYELSLTTQVSQQDAQAPDMIHENAGQITD